jgi:predicted nucleic acid-binding protein
MTHQTIVIDTNVWIGLIAESASFEADKLAFAKAEVDFEAAFTKETYEELEHLLTRVPTILANTDPELREAVLQSVRDHGIFYEIEKQIEGISPDESDHRFLEAAVVSGAAILLTNNTKDLGHLDRFEGTLVVTSKEFLLMDSNQQEFEKIRAARIQKCRSRLKEMTRQSEELRTRLKPWLEMDQQSQEWDIER